MTPHSGLSGRRRSWRDTPRKISFTIYTASNLPGFPERKFSYSNAAAQFVGAGFGARLRKSYEELVRIKITGPLKMNDTKVTLTAAGNGASPEGI